MSSKNSLKPITVLIFIVLATIYFLPKPILNSTLPELAVKYRIVGPLLVLSVAGIFTLPWQMTLAMTFSAFGDFMGAYGSFPGQMGFFTSAHIMLIIWFLSRFKTLPKDKSRTYRLLTASVTFLVLVSFAFTCIIPSTPSGAIRAGCGIYAGLICAMFCITITLKQPILFVGAALFLFSDIVLSWNKFVSPIAARKWLIMIPYYSGQLLLWTGAARLFSSDAEYRKNEDYGND